MKKQIETEVKYKISNSEREEILKALLHLGFLRKSKEQLSDYYLVIEKSPVRGWNFERLRIIDGKKAVLAKKQWIKIKDEFVREEKEEEITLNKAVKMKNSDGVKLIIKERDNFEGRINNYEAIISIDRLEINGEISDYIEVEIMTNINESKEAKEQIIDWINNFLKIDTKVQAPSMIELVGIV